MLFKRRFFLVTLLSCCFSLLFSLAGWTQASVPEALNQEAFVLLNRGEPAAALQLWKQAESIYRNENNQEGEIGTQLNQAIAEQALGLYPRACSTITQAIALPREICQTQQESALRQSLSTVKATEVNGIGLRLLGESLSLLGNLEEARLALETAKTCFDAGSIEWNHIDLALGNLYRLLAKESIQNYQRLSFREIERKNDAIIQAATASKGALGHYQAAMDSGDTGMLTKARLNIIGMFADASSGLSLSDSKGEPAVLLQLDAMAQEAFQTLEYQSFEQLPIIESIYSQLNLAQSLLSIRLKKDKAFWNDISNVQIESLITNAAATAQQIQNSRAISSAYGIDGDFLFQEKQSIALAAERYQQALSLAQSVQASDIAYQWAYALAQLSEASGNLAQSDEYYQSAIAALSEVRNDLLAIDSELRFSFKEEIEPVYQSYIRFLSQSQRDPNRAIKIHSSLQLAQLENLLRCGRLVSIPDTPNRTTIHVINLGDTVETVVSQNNEFYSYSSPASQLLLATESLIANTQSESFQNIPESEFLPYAQSLYDQLLRPAQEAGWMPENSELNFVLDAPFQSLSMAMLHDGQQYLAETHPISLSLQMQQIEKERGEGGLFGGLSEVAPSFAEAPEFSNLPLPETEYEASYLDKYVRSERLLNEAFTAEHLGRKLAKENFEIVHFSTHGQFSSDPAETFLLAWDERIDFAELGQLFQSAEGIDLLFLSACETAAGDERSALGLAGLAVQSGASNVIATLWLEDSTGGSIFVNSFYEALSEDNTSPSRALQEAQKRQMRTDGLSHPYYWAPFVLAAS